MWRKTVLVALVLCVATLAPGQKKKMTGAPATPPQQDKVVQILRTPNKAQVNQFVCETLEIRNTNPFNIINFFWAVTSREDGGCYSYANPDGKSGKIVVICPEYQLESLRALAKELDRPNQNSAPGSKYIYHRLKYRSAIDPGFVNSSAVWGGSSGVFVPDVETNSILLYDAPEGADSVDKSLNEVFDKPLQQVEFQVNVYEVEVNNDGTLGLDYEAWKNGPGHLLLQESGRGQYLHTAGVPNTHFHTSGGGVFLDYPSAFFDALVEKGKAVSMVNTRITGVNRVPAMLTSDEKVIFYQVSNPSPTQRFVDTSSVVAAVNGLVYPNDGRVVATKTRTPYDSNTFLKGRAPHYTVEKDGSTTFQPINAAIRSVTTGLFLTIVPTVGEGMVNMDMDLRLVNHTGYAGDGTPTLNSRQISNAMAVVPGDEIIFGGLVRDRKIQNAKKVPLLGSLPVIGYLFGGETTSNKQTVVVASIKPVLVAGDNNVTAADKATIAKVSGEQVLVLPQSEFCFEQNIPYIH